MLSHERFARLALGQIFRVIIISNLGKEISGSWYRAKRITITPNTPSEPLMAFLRDATFQRSPCTTSAPSCLSFRAFSELVLRVTALGVNVPSASNALITDEPIGEGETLLCGIGDDNSGTLFSGGTEDSHDVCGHFL